MGALGNPDEALFTSGPVSSGWCGDVAMVRIERRACRVDEAGMQCTEDLQSLTVT
jgi:hypothetical protein